MAAEHLNQKDVSLVRVNLISCKSILSRSRIPGLEYCINPYTGCLHGCIYCYARFMNKFSPEPRQWGSYVDVKINAVEILKKQLVRLKGVNVSLSTVTDPYQAVEKRHQLTRRMLVELAAAGCQVSILTKSDLVERDIDVLKQFKPGECEVGFSLATLDEKIKQDFEYRSPPVKNRIDALKRLHREGIRTWVFIAPVLPFLTGLSLPALLEEIRDSVDYVMVDSLNIKGGNWPGISEILKRKYPSLLSSWKAICLTRTEKRNYYEKFQHRLVDLSRKNHICLQLC